MKIRKTIFGISRRPGAACCSSIALTLLALLVSVRASDSPRSHTDSNERLTGEPHQLLQTGQKDGEASPRAELDASTHDFGDVFAGELLTRNFTVKNNGSAPLELSDKSPRRAGLPAGSHFGFAARMAGAAYPASSRSRSAAPG